jgi:hypothetical protein
MKKSFIQSAVIVLLGFAAISCSKEDMGSTSIQSVNQDLVPSSVVKTVTSTFANATTVEYSVIASNSLYNADVKTPTSSTSVVLNKSGKIRETAVQITQAELPKTILDYLTGKYPNYTFDNAAKKIDSLNVVKGYRVELTFNTEKYSNFFDANGGFLAEIKGMIGKPNGMGMGPGGMGPGGKNADKPAPAATITEADLPAAVKSAIAGYTFKTGVLIVDKAGAKLYHVHLEKDGTVYNLTYDESGKLVEKSAENAKGADVTKATITTLPDKIKAYLDANAKGWTLQNAVAISKDNVIIHYHVVVTVAGSSQTFMFDKDLNLLTTPGKGPKDNQPLPNVVVNELTKDKIPTDISTYLNANYAGWTLIKALSITKDGAVLETEVFFTIGDKKYKSEFDGTNKFLSTKVL